MVVLNIRAQKIPKILLVLAIRILAMNRIVRVDCPHNIKKHAVAVFISWKLKFITVDCSIDNVVIVHLCSLNVYVVTVYVYRPPSNSVESNNAPLGFIAEFCIDMELCVHGDFTHRKLFFEILLNQTVIRLYLPFCDLI